MGIFSGIQPFSSTSPKNVVPKLELNIRLDVRGRSNSIEANTHRAEEVIGLLRSGLSKKTQFRRSASPSGKDFLWAGSSIEADPEDLERIAFKVAEIAEQDCVAVYYRGRNEGKLIGPLARNWGQFNINAFRSFLLEE